MKETSTILCHVTHNVLGVEQITYEWQGKSKYTFVSSGFPQTRKLVSYSDSAGETFEIGPYRLKVVEFDVMTGYFYCVREDYYLSGLIVLFHRISKHLRIGKAKFIITLAVWGLASYSPQLIPSWYDVYAIKKIKSWIK